MGERIEEGVGGRVIGLAGSAEDSGDRGEENEGCQVTVLGEFVQMPGGIELGGEDAVDALGVHGAE
jgi:hypothetical protein